MLKETAEAYEKEGSYKEAIDAFQQVYIHHSSFRVRAKVIGFLVLGFTFFFPFVDTINTPSYCLFFWGGGVFFLQASDFFAGEKSTQGSNQCKVLLIAAYPESVIFV